MTTSYGPRSRTVANPHPRVYPPEPPSTTTVEARWCHIGSHETREPERWPNDRGCSKHDSTTKPANINGWTACAVCGKTRRPSSYLLGYMVGSEKCCDVCGVEKRR